MLRPRAVPEALAWALPPGQIAFKCLGQVLQPSALISINFMFEFFCSTAVSFKAALPDTGKAFT